MLLSVAAVMTVITVSTGCASTNVPPTQVAFTATASAAAQTPGPTSTAQATSGSPSLGVPATPTPVAGPTRSPLVEPPAFDGIVVTVEREAAVSREARSVDDRTWEPVVATHPTDPDRIAVIFEHRGPGADCRTNPVIRISRDGGATWRSTTRSPTAGSGRGNGLHAAIAWGPGPAGRDRLYWANMTSPGCGAGRFSLSTTYSDDEGATWSPLRVERRTPPWVGGFPDIAVDRDPASPAYGAVYVGYNWLGKGAHGPGLRLLASSDFGDTFSGTEVAPAPTTPGYRDWWRIGYRLRTDRAGAVYVSWYQADLRRWDRTSIFRKGGPSNVGRLGVAVARVEWDPVAETFDVGPSRIAATVRETPFTTNGVSAPGTGGYLRPDPMWLHGLDVDPATGRLFLAVAEYGQASGDAAQGALRVGRSDDGGATWSFSILPRAPNSGGHRQSAIRPNIVVGEGFVVVTFRTVDDVTSNATVGGAFCVSTDGGATWARPVAISRMRWRARDLAGVVNGMGLRERAERRADGNVFWAYGVGPDATTPAGQTAVYGATLQISVGSSASSAPN